MTLKESLLFIAGLFVVMLILDKLFGTIPASYSVWIFGAGYLFGDSLGFDRGRKSGRREADIEIEKEFEREHRNKQHNKLMESYTRENNNQEISVLGVGLEKKYFPKLYQWAMSNPATLEDTLQSVADKWHNGNLTSAAQALESDLQHG